MPAYNFKERFAAQVQRGEKRQTIRRPRKHTPRVGQTAYCFYGMRTKKCKRLGEWPIRAVERVRIGTHGVLFIQGRATFDQVICTEAGLDLFARLDGFLNWLDMREWFSRHYGLPFEGELTRW